MKKRIFLGPVEISGYYSNLAMGLREIGYDVSFFIRFRHMSGYPIPNSNYLLRLHRIISDKRISISKKKIVLKVLFVTLQVVFERILFIYFLFTHSVFIYTFLQTFFKSAVDLKILKLFNKRIIMVSNGSDLRPPYLIDLYNEENFPDEFLTIDQMSSDKKKYLKKIENYADCIVGGIFRCHFLEKPFIERSFLGRPVYFKNEESYLALYTEKSVRREVYIVHAPSSKKLKGTDEIQLAINNLIKKKYKIKFELIEEKPNSYVIDAIKKCDFVIDQVYSDILMPGLSSEAAKYGKAVIVGGYKLDLLKRLLPDELIPPVLNCKPEELEQMIELLVVDHDLRNKIGQELKEFITTKSHYKSVALNYQKLIDNRFPNEWYINPYDIIYTFGVGINKEKLREKLKEYVKERGIKALYLQDKPSLEGAFIEFIGDC